MLRRTGFARKTYTPPPAAPLRPLQRPVVLARITDTARPRAKEVKARPGKRAPTVLEREWLDAIVAYGCICCHLDGQAPRPTAVHHILRGGRRIGHLFSLPLCDPGHHQGGQPLGLLCRHPNKAQFEARYGTELELLQEVKTRIGWTKG